MSEHRTVTLTNTKTLQEVTVTATVVDLTPEELEHVAPDEVEDAAVARSAEIALIAYRKDHPGDYLVTGITRGGAA